MNDLLKTIGKTLYGLQWQSDLARELGVADRTIRRWVAGDFEMPAGAREDLRQLCLKRSAELAELAGQIDAG